MTKLLLKAGADVNAQGECYENALQTAAHFAHEKNFKLLLEHSAVVTQEEDFDSSQNTASYRVKDISLHLPHTIKWNHKYS